MWDFRGSMETLGEFRALWRIYEGIMGVYEVLMRYYHGLLGVNGDYGGLWGSMGDL